MISHNDLTLQQNPDFCKIVIPMREITVVEKVDGQSITPSAIHVMTKSKVNLEHLQCFHFSMKF